MTEIGPLMIRRRHALMMLATPAIAGAGLPVTGLRLLPSGKRGFELVEAGLVLWQVEIPDDALGPNCRLSLDRENADGGLIRCLDGSLIGEAAELLIEVHRQHGAWRAIASITIGTWLRVVFPSMPAAKGPVFGALLPGSAATEMQSRLFPHRKKWFGAKLMLYHNFRAGLTLPGVGPLWPGLPPLQHWGLLPGMARQGPYTMLAVAQTDALPPRLKIPVGSNAGAKVAFSVATPKLTLVRDAAGFSGVLVQGKQTLSVGTDLLTLDSSHPAAFAAFGLTSKPAPLVRIQAWLPSVEHLVSTGRGDVVLKGGSGPGPDVDVAGNGVQISHFRASADMSHVTLRLPLEAGTQDFADLGRLDFSDFRLGLTLGALPLAATPGGRLPDGVLPLAAAAGKPAELSLNKARLHVRRSRDLLSLV